MKFLFALVFMFAGCSDSYDETYKADPGVPDAEFDKIKPLIAANCGGCHGKQAGIPSFGSGAAFKSSNAKAELTAGNMPPAGHTISDDDKAALLAYLK